MRKNLRNKARGKILAVLLSVMLILTFLPAGIAFATPATPAPTISQASGIITTSATVGIGNIAPGDTAYYTIASGSVGIPPTVTSFVYSAPFVVSATAGTDRKSVV